MSQFLDYGWLGLFLIAFLSATILPFPSEFALLFFLANDYNPWMVLFIAPLGNSLGGTTTYFLGRLFQHWRKVPETSRSYKLVNTYGIYSAVLSWIPIIGDPILLILGYFKTPVLPTLILMTIGKAFRYTVLCLPWL